MIKAPDKNPATSSPALQVGDVVEIICTDLIAKTGQAVGRANGMVVYVAGPVPGERARVRIEVLKAKYAVAELIELLSLSKDRAEPFCAVFGACGGCQVQHLAYPAQLHWKRGLVENALRRIGGIENAIVSETIGMDEPRAYRNKMALVVEHREEPLFGFYAARTHDVVPVRTCPIVLPALDRIVGGLWEAAASPELAPAFTDARHVVARAGEATGKTVVSLTTERRSPALAARGAALARHLDVAGVSNSFEPPSDNAVMGRKNATVAGKAELDEEIDGLRFRVSPGSFFQVNSRVVAKIFAYLEPHAVGVRSVLDLYCGAGTFALFFAKQGAQVFGIEENAHAVREARANAELDQVADRTAFASGRVETFLRGKAGRELLAAAEVVFLDPPRKGSDETTLRTLGAARVPRIWYLSCNPATLARDLAWLSAAGYELEVVQPFDMFPQTGHIEALAMLRRTEP